MSAAYRGWRVLWSFEPNTANSNGAAAAINRLSAISMVPVPGSHGARYTTGNARRRIHMSRCLGIIVLTLLLPVSPQAWDLGPVGTFQFEPINDGVHVMHGPLEPPSKANFGFMNNPGIVDVGEGLVLVDPGGSYLVGKKVLEEIGKVSSKPILAVFNTHIHGDHWLGNQAVKEAYPQAKIYAHPEMIRQAVGGEGQSWIDLMNTLTEGASQGTTLVTPDKESDYGVVITVAGHRFRIHGQAPAHTDTDIMIEHVDSKTLFLGDNSFNKRMARFDASSNMHGNLEALRAAAKLDIEVFVPGHGRSGPREQSLQPFMDYIQALIAAVKPGYEDGLADYEIKENILVDFESYRGWSGFDEQFGKHVGKIYLEIEELDL